MKQKTRKSVTKRFKVTSRGKIMRRSSFSRHLNEKRSSRQKRRLAGVKKANPTLERKIRKYLGVRVK